MLCVFAGDFSPYKYLVGIRNAQIFRRLFLIKGRNFSSALLVFFLFRSPAGVYDGTVWVRSMLFDVS